MFEYSAASLNVDHIESYFGENIELFILNIDFITVINSVWYQFLVKKTNFFHLTNILRF